LVFLVVSFLLLTKCNATYFATKTFCFVTESSKARNVFISLNTERVGSNLVRSMDVYLYSLCCEGSGLATRWSPVQEVLLTFYNIRNLIINSDWEQDKRPNPSR
jgi:hypothetical protein